MTISHAIILGIVQGLTEFLPISSSGHLNVFPWLFNWEMLSEGMDVALHIGTLLALIIFFFKDWVTLIKGGYNQTIKRQPSTEGKMFWYLVLATIPAGILSLILDKIADKIIGDNINTQMAIIACTLIIMGIVLYIVDKRSKSKIDYEHITLKQAVLIGISQALAAAFPGVSRSGITMTMGRFLNVDRESVARYSFMLSAPIVLAATVFKFSSFVFNPQFFIGVISSFLVGVAVIKFLMQYLKKGSFKIFAIYRVLVGLAVLIIYFVK